MVKKILIVDDNAVNRKYAKSVMSKINTDIIEAESGMQALKLIGEHTFDLILMDIQMPEMDGFEVLERIRQDYPAIKCPILAITAFYGDYGRSTFIEAGFDQFLQKPVKPYQLIEIVESWLKGTPTNPLKVVKSEDEIIDMSVYLEIKKYARNQDINDLYIEFENETAEFFTRLKFLITSKNYPEILSTLHTIKGNSGSLGITMLATSAEKLETDIRTNTALDLTSRIKELEDIFSRYREDYKQLLKI